MTEDPASDDVAALPVARVMVDVPLAHLDRPFDYAVPDGMLATAVPGCRVRVRFAGRLVDGYVLSREARSGHDGRLAPLARVVSPEPVLTPEIAALCRAVADRWAGTMPDVVRLAVPPRHARAEAGAPAAAPGASPEASPDQGGKAQLAAPADAAGWAAYRGGEPLLATLGSSSVQGPGRHPRAVWSALPGEDWPLRLAELAAAVAGAGRGSVLVVPDQRDVDRLDAALVRVLGPDRHVTLTASLGPAERYRRFLAVVRGQVRVVAGTRAAAWAPVPDVGLVAVWDDGDDLHLEQHAPYPHTRDVLLLRAHLAGCGAVVGGWARTAEAQRLVQRRWAYPVVAPRELLRRRAPRVISTGDTQSVLRDASATSARLPHVAFEAARAALGRGEPVLVQVPRRGYVPVLSCARCRRPARCPHCHGPVRLPARGSVPECGWCARPTTSWTCPGCDGTALRSAVVGSARTAEELGRAFPGVPVLSSSGTHVIPEVAGTAALVVATPGAEPVAPGGYGALLLLDAWIPLGAPGLQASEEALRRWLGAAALVRPASAGGTVVVSADPSLRPVAALVRWDPVWAATRELEDRAELGFPPAAAMVSLTGSPEGIAELVTSAAAVGAEILGPVPVPVAGAEGRERVLLRVSSEGLAELARLLRAGQAARSARKAPDPVRVQVDPYDLG